jgi:hypothetical protein
VLGIVLGLIELSVVYLIVAKLFDSI